MCAECRRYGELKKGRLKISGSLPKMRAIPIGIESGDQAGGPPISTVAPGLVARERLLSPHLHLMANLQNQQQHNS